MQYAALTTLALAAGALSQSVAIPSQDAGVLSALAAFQTNTALYGAYLSAATQPNVQSALAAVETASASPQAALSNIFAAVGSNIPSSLQGQYSSAVGAINAVASAYTANPTANPTGSAAPASHNAAAAPTGAIMGAGAIAAAVAGVLVL